MSNKQQFHAKTAWLHCFQNSFRHHCKKIRKEKFQGIFVASNWCLLSIGFCYEALCPWKSGHAIAPVANCSQAEYSSQVKQDMSVTEFCDYWKSSFQGVVCKIFLMWILYVKHITLCTCLFLPIYTSFIVRYVIKSYIWTVEYSTRLTWAR